MAANRRFAKLCCGGNDFIIVDFRDAALPEDIPSLARTLCARRTGVGADGLIALVADSDHPFGLLLHNADGSPAEVSYNGSRCAGRYAFEAGIVPEEFSFASGAGPIRARVEGSAVELEVPPPSGMKPHLRVRERGETVLGHAIQAGVPYFVIFRDDLNELWVETVPPLLRTNSAFAEGTNVAVALRKGAGLYEARFFERGVAEETSSSGSGCVAVALVAAQLHGDSSPVTVATRGGDFAISFSRQGSEFRGVSTAGEVRFVFRGELTGETLAAAG